jgi:hypothetical protein
MTHKVGVYAAVLFAAALCPLIVSGSIPTARNDAPEFQFARLVYTSVPWSEGSWGGPWWMTDAPEAETHLLQGVHRLTRVNASDGSKPTRLEDDSLFDHPFLYGVEVGHWHLSDREAARLREYLLRGGFLMVDDFHGTLEWETFMQSMRRVFPDRPVVEIANTDEIFHVLYDLNERPQIPGLWGVMTGRTYERDGYTPHWRGVYDDNGRLMMAINFNMDLGDAWEHADTPQYPQPLTAMAYRFAINYILYSMTH